MITNTLRMDEATPRNSAIRRKSTHKINRSIFKQLENNRLHTEGEDCEDLVKATRARAFQRTTDDIVVILKYLQHTELMNKFKKEKLSENSYNNLMFGCAKNLDLTFLRKGETLFRIDDIGDKFYIIIKGSIGVYKPIEKQTAMTTHEYYNHIVLLNSKDEKFIVQKTVKLNQSIIPIFDVKDNNNNYRIMFKIKMINTLKEFDRDLEPIRRLSKVYPTYFEEFKLDLDEIRDLYLKEKKNRRRMGMLIRNTDENQMMSELEGTDDDVISKYFNKKLEITNYESELIERFREFTDYDTKREITVFDYTCLLSLQTGKYFGDFALDKSNKRRSATIKAEEDCVLGVITDDIYEQYIFHEKHKIKMKEVAFINDGFFFYKIKNHVFERKYFQHFFPYELNRNHTFFKEGDLIDKLVIIKEGVIHFSYEGSLIELQDKLKYITECFLSKVKNLEIKIEMSYKQFEEYLDDKVFKMQKFKPKKYNDYILKKRKFDLFMISTREMCGMEELYLGFLTHHFKATVSSEKCCVYFLDIKDVKIIFDDEKHMVKNPFIKLGNHKVMSLMQRMFNLRKSFMDIFFKRNDEDEFENIFKPKNIILKTPNLTLRDSTGIKKGNTSIIQSESYSPTTRNRNNENLPMTANNSLKNIFERKGTIFDSITTMNSISQIKKDDSKKNIHHTEDIKLKKLKSKFNLFPQYANQEKKDTSNIIHSEQKDEKKTNYKFFISKVNLLDYDDDVNKKFKRDKSLSVNNSLGANDIEKNENEQQLIEYIKKLKIPKKTRSVNKLKQNNLFISSKNSQFSTLPNLVDEKKKNSRNVNDDFFKTNFIENTIIENLPKFKYSVTKVKNFYQLAKEGGYKRNMLPSNSLLRLKLNKRQASSC